MLLLLILDIYLLQSDSFWLWQFMGRLHPMVVHFPLSLLLLATVLEVVSIQKFDSKWRPAIEVMLYVGAFSAVASAGLGYMLMIHDQYEGDGVELHQKLGIATAVFSMLCLWMYIRSHRKPVRNRVMTYRSTL